MPNVTIATKLIAIATIFPTKQKAMQQTNKPATTTMTANATRLSNRNFPKLPPPLQRIDESGEARDEFCALAMEKEMLDIAALELKIYRLRLCRQRRLERL